MRKNFERIFFKKRIDFFSKEEGRSRSSFFDTVWLLCSQNMKNGFSSGRGFLRPFPQKSLLLAIRPPSRPTNRNASSLDSPLAYVQTMRLRVAFTFSTRFFHPFSSSLFLSKRARCLQIFLFNHPYLPLVLIYLFNIYFQSTSSMVASAPIDPSSSYGWSVLAVVPLVGRSLAGRQRKDPSVGSYPISTWHALSTILTPHTSRNCNLKMVIYFHLLLDVTLTTKLRCKSYVVFVYCEK